MKRKLKSSLSMFLSAAIATSSIPVVASAETDFAAVPADVALVAKASVDNADAASIQVVATPAVTEVAMDVVEPVEKLALPAEGVGPFASGSASVSISGDGVLTVSGSGDMGDFASSAVLSYENAWYPYLESVKEIVIADTITSIGDYAFFGFTSVTKVTIGKGVKEIGNSAFYGCTALTTLTDNSTGLQVYGDKSFYNCEKLATVTLADTLTSIGASAFYGCKQFDSLTIPGSVGENLGAEAFYGCSGLKTVIIEDGIKTIGEGAFCDCILLEKVKLPETTLTTIGERAFSGCAALSTIDNNSECFEVPTTVTTIGESAFASCAAIKALLIEGGVTTIGAKAFMSCSELKDVNISGNQETAIGASAFASCGKLTGVTLNNGNVTTIDEKAFYQSGLQNVALSDTLTTIGDSAFAETHLKALKLPASVVTVGSKAFSSIAEMATLELVTDGRTVAMAIGIGAFESCTGLKTITTLEGVNNFGEKAFNGCTSLTTVTLPSTTTVMGKMVFSDCTSLTSFNIADGATVIGVQVIHGSPVTAVTVPKSVVTNKQAFEGHGTLATATVNCEKIQDAMFKKCTKLESVTLKNTLTVGGSTFEGCSSIKTIALPSSITSMGTAVFKDCTSLTAISLPVGMTYVPNSICEGCSSLESAIYGNVTAINLKAFKNCASLKSAYIPDTVQSIGSETFSGCAQITTAVMNGVKRIDSKAFYDCTALRSVTFGENLNTLSANVFENCSSLASVDIPDGVKVLSAALFKNCVALSTVSGASNATTIGANTFEGCAALSGYKIPDTVTSIGASAFLGCSLLDCDIPDSVATIGTAAFKNCVSLGKTAAITLPNNEKFITISNETFSGCTSLPAIVIPESVTAINDKAFMGCSSAKFNIIALSENVTKIGGSTFENCTNLTNVTIDSGEFELTIGTNAFAGCTALRSITLPNKLKTVMGSAFLNCTSLTNITLPSYVTSLGNDVFNGCTALEKATISGIKVVAIPNNLFLNCSSLETIVLPPDITSIGQKAFMGCASLSEVTIPGKVTNIAANAFDGCTSLTYVVLPVSLKQFGGSVFANCTNLETVIYLSASSPAATSKYFDGCDKLTIYCYEGSAIENTYAKKNNIPVKYLAGQDGSYVVIIKQPQGIAGVKIGETVTFSVKVASEGKLTYEWFYKNPGDENYTKATDFTGTEYSVKVTEQTDGQKVYCVVTSVSSTDESVSNQVVSDTAYISTITAPTASVASKAPQAIALKWSKVDAATGYEIYRVESLADVMGSPIATVGDVDTYTDKSVVVGTTYYYYVVAVNDELEVKSELSEAVKVTVPKPMTAPANVKAVAGEGQVTLTWDEVDGATDYYIYTYLNGEYKRVGLTSDTTYVATGLVAGTKYGFLVRAFADGVGSPFTVNDVVYATPTASTKPVVTATPGAGQVTLSWKAVNGATNYSVYAYVDGKYKGLGYTTGTSYTATGLTGGTKYGFLVRACVNGVWSTFTANDLVYATPTSASTKPVVTATPGAGQVALSWKAVSGATKYAVYTYIDGQYKGVGQTTSTAYNVGNLTGGTKYGFLVRAYVNNAWTAFTVNDLVYATPTSASTKPVVTATPGAGQVALSWKAVSGATNYAVYAYVNGQYKGLGYTTGTSYTATGLTGGTKYGFLVRACVNGAWSTFTANDLVYATPTSASTKPVVTATPGAGQVTLSWKAVSGATNYSVYAYVDGQYKGLGYTTGTSYTATGLTGGKEYGFLVKACVNGAWSAFTANDLVYATPTSASTKPVVTATPGAGQVALSWKAVSGATNYSVYAYVDGQYKGLGYTTGTSYTATGLTGGKEYGFLVRACVNGAWSAFTTNDLVYATPTASTKPVVTATGGVGQATLTWNAVSGATNYAVYTYINGNYTGAGLTTDTTKVVTGLTSGTNCGFLVRAYVNGAWSAFTANDVVYANIK